MTKQEVLVRNAKPNEFEEISQRMTTAWKMYEKLGFKRSEDLDFRQGELAVFGFRLKFA